MSSTTLRQVADEAGVSVQTVSNVLNNRTQQRWPSTRERARRIRDIATRMGYRPNAAARAVVTGRHGAVGLLVGRQRDHSPLPYDLLTGLDAALTRIDQHLVLARLSDKKLTDPDYVPSILRLWMVDGLLISYQNVIPPRMTELIRDCELPAVWLNSKQANDCVYHDDVLGGELATRHLLELGHRRIAYLECSYYEGEVHYSAVDRRLGYEQMMRDAGLTPRSFYGKRADPAMRRDWVMNILRGPDRPTAVVCYGDETFALLDAVGCMGLRMPEDLSVVTFQDLPPLSYLNATLTRVKLDFKGLTRHAVEMLDRKLQGDRSEQPSVAVTPRLMVRRSTHEAY